MKSSLAAKLTKFLVVVSITVLITISLSSSLVAAKGDDSGRLGGSRRCGGHAKNHSSTSARPLLSSITSFLFYAALVLHYAMEHYACMNI